MMFKIYLTRRFLYSEPPDGSWGKRLSNGSYNGMIGMVHRNEVDLAVGPFTMTQERGAVVQFTSPIYFDFVTILVGSQQEGRDLFPFLGVFQKWVWVCVFVFFVSCLSVYIAVEYVVKIKKRQVRLIHLVGRSFIYFWGTLTSRSLSMPIRATTSQNFILTISMIGSALVGWTLCGKLLSYLLVVKAEDFIKNLEDFQRFPNVIPVLESGASVESMFENSKTESARYIWWLIQKNRSASLIPTKQFQTKLQMDKILIDTRYAAISEETTVMALLSERVEKKWKCGFHVTELMSFVKPMSIAISKLLSPERTKIFKICSNQMVESGLIDQDIKHDSEQFPLCLKIIKPNGPTVLVLVDLAGILTIYAVGTLISLITFVIEIIIGKYSSPTPTSSNVGTFIKSLLSYVIMEPLRANKR